MTVNYRSILPGEAPQGRTWADQRKGGSVQIKANANVANPYLPIWEHIPDGEPRIFKDPQTGEQRLYVYGSHDSRMDHGYCGPDHVAWSAPLDDLSDWRFEGKLIDTSALVGVSCMNADGQEETIVENSSRVLYAPDVIYYPDDEM